MKGLILGLIFLIANTICYSQSVWESFGTNSSPWIVSSELKCNQNTTTKLDIINKNYPSEDNIKNNTWTAETTWINTDSFNNSPTDISFTVKNLSSPTQSNYLTTSTGISKLYSGNIYWDICVYYTSLSGQDKYFKINYCLEKSGYGGTAESSCTRDNGTQSCWENISKMTYRKYRIIFEDDKIRIYDNNGDHLYKTIDNVKKLRKLEVGAGPGTQLEITNTSCQRMTTYGQSLPYLQKAANYMDNNNASSAASEMTTAINKGLKCYDTYLMRGIAYYMQGYYKSAIEDLSSAINYSSSNKELAYYYRGMSKLALDDDYGINDLKNGGQDGLVFLRENNLMNYTPGQNKKKTTTNTSKRKTISSQPKKPALKK